MNDTTDETAPVGGARPGAGRDEPAGDSATGHPDPGSATGQQTGQQTGRAQGPRRTHLEEIDRLRRSSSDRKVAGVAGGLARHFDLDPILFRVLFVVLTFFGGAGLLLYGALWLLVPEDGRADAPVHTSPETRRTALIAVLVVAALLAIGDSWGGWTFGWPLAVIAVFVALYLVLQDRGRSGTREGPADQQYAPAMGTTYDEPRTAGAAGPVPPGAPESGVETSAGYRWTAAGAGAPPSWQAPTGEPPAQPHRPRRTGTVWFWPTLGLLAIGLGILGLYDADNAVADGAYLALATAIIGVMLLVGAVRGRPGGLIFLGVLTTLGLTATVVVGSEFGGDAQQIELSPATAAAVSSHYEASVGEIRLDLTDVRDPEELAGRTIDLELRTGEIHVIVPDNLNLRLDAELEYAGGINVPDNDGGGWTPSVDRYYAGSPATDDLPLELDIDAKFGQITVEHR